ncbi:MAG TPA: biotin/lipoyl-containing protein, partial [Nocardioides sp.]|nr:biotin/lipoyl-containing protein [Nocardioides sp.]
MDIKVPDLGNFTDVAVIEIFVEPGQVVAAEDPLLTLETDKATMDIPAPFAGTINSLTVKLGDKVNKGDVIGTAEPEASESAPADGSVGAVPSSESAPAGAPAAGEAARTPGRDSPPATAGATSADGTAPTDSSAPSDTEGLRATPLVRRLARELEIDLDA